MKKELSEKQSKIKYYIMLALVGGLLLTACGGKEAASESMPPTAETNVETDSGDAAMPSESATPEGDEATETENNTGTGTAGDNPTGSGAGDKNEDGQTANGAADSQQDTASQASGQTGAPNNTPADDGAGNSASAAQELNGSIETLGDHIFTVNKVFTEVDENGGMIAYSSKEDKTLIDVAYTDTTSFIICTSKDMGITSTNTPATSAALETGRSVLMKGSWNGDVFSAAEVTIYHFE